MLIKTILDKGQGNSYWIPLPEDKAQKAIKKFGKRVICTVNETTWFHCGIQRSNKVGYYLGVGKAIKKKIAIDAFEAIKIKLAKDTSKYGVEMPEELKVVLETDYEGEQTFEALTAGKKRSIIHFVIKVKSSQLRIDRSLKVIENLKMGITDSPEIFQ